MRWKFLLILFLNVTAAAAIATTTPTPVTEHSLWDYFMKFFPANSAAAAAVPESVPEPEPSESSQLSQSSPSSQQSLSSSPGSVNHEIVFKNEKTDEDPLDPMEDQNNENQDQPTEAIPQEKQELIQQQEKDITTNATSSSSSASFSAPSSPSASSSFTKVLNETELELILQDVEQLISVEKYSDAIHQLLTILEIYPNHQKANSLIGYCFLTIDEAKTAENFLYIAISESNFTDFYAILNFIESLKINEKYETAISFILHLKSFPNEIIEKFESTFSDYYSLNYLLGTIYEYKKDYSMAQEWYLAAALKNPTNGNGAAWLRASSILFPIEEKNLTFAEAVLLQGIKYNPLNAELIFNLGSLLHATNRILEAKILYEETLRLNPNMTGALANLATVLHTIGQLTEAKEYYERAILLSANNTILLVNYALCLSNLKFHSAAYEAIEQASLLDPNDLTIQTDKKKLALLMQNMKQTKENLLNNIHKLFAERNFEEIVNNLISYGEPVEDGAWWYYTMGIAEYFRKQYGNSVQFCSIANTLTNQKSILINSCLGLAYQSTGIHSKANVYFEQSYELSYTNTTEVMPFFIFNISENDTKYNLLQSYSMNSQYDKCLTASCEMFQLPTARSGGVIVLAFSYVQWSKSGQERMNAYQKEQEQTEMNQPKEQSKNKIKIHAGKLLSEEVTRIQTLPSELLKTTYYCLSALNSEQHSELFQIRNDAFLTLNNLANSPTESSLENITTETKSESDEIEMELSLRDQSLSTSHPRIILVSSFLFPSHVITSFDRQISFLLQNTLQNNLNNPLIDEIYLINQIEYNFSKLTNSQKLKQFILNRRVRYSDLFRLANEAISSNDLVIFSSCDILFDSSLSFLKNSSIFHRKDRPNQFNVSDSTEKPNDLLMALTAWNSVPDSNLFTLSIRIDKQDVWILRPPIDSRIISLSDFTIGSKRSDNRLANVFLESGYRVYNPAFTIRAIQSDPTIRNHSLFMNADVAIGSYSDVLFSDSGVFIN